MKRMIIIIAVLSICLPLTHIAQANEYWEKAPDQSYRAMAFEEWNGIPLVVQIPEQEGSWETFCYTKESLLAERYEIAENSQYYTVIDGVLYSKDRSILYLYPAMKQGWYFQVPSSVTTLSESSFFGSYYLRELVLPDSLTTIEGWCTFHECCVERLHFSLTDIPEFDIDALGWLPYIQSIIVPENSTIALALQDADESEYLPLISNGNIRFY